jgi:hypothetical protein
VGARAEGGQGEVGLPTSPSDLRLLTPFSSKTFILLGFAAERGWGVNFDDALTRLTLRAKRARRQEGAPQVHRLAPCRPHSTLCQLSSAAAWCALVLLNHTASTL